MRSAPAITTATVGTGTIGSAVSLPHGTGTDWSVREAAGLQEQALRAGASVEIGEIPGGVRFAWSSPVAAGGAFSPQPAP